MDFSQPRPLAFLAFLSLTALALASLALGVLLGAYPGTFIYSGVFAGAALVKIAALRPWGVWPRISWPRALAFCAALLAGCAAAWFSPGLEATSGKTAAFALMFSGGWVLGNAWPAPRGAAPPESERLDLLCAGLLGAAAFYALVLLTRDWLLAHFNGPGFGALFFYMSRRGYASYPNITSIPLPPRQGYEGIPGSPFQWSAALAWPLLWWGATLACAAWAYQAPGLKRVWTLAAAGAVGKFALAPLSGTGLQVLPQKITAISTAYYKLAMDIAQGIGLRPDPGRPHLAPIWGRGAWYFIRHFNAFLPWLGTHGQSHPFGPELFYWLIVRAGGGPWACAVVVCALTALTPVLLYLLALELGFAPRAGLAAALLYLASPAACVLSTSGIDSIISLTFVAAALAAVRAVRRNSAWPALLSGLLLFAASLLTVAAAYLALMLALAAAAYRLNRPQGARDGLKPTLLLVFLAPCVLHGALWAAAGGGFRYLEVVRDVKGYCWFSGSRPAYLWSWLDPLLYFGFAGAGTLVLTASSGLAWLLERRRPPLAALIPLAVLAQLWLQGFAFGECQRVFHWGYAALSLLALSVPFTDWKKDRGFTILAALATLNALTSIVLMMTLMDYW